MPKGQMIRREHVVQSFVKMCADPQWGVPSRLYFDNGGEFNFSEIADDLAKLKHNIELPDQATLQAGLGTQRARAHNPQGKVIETFSSSFERVTVAQLSGYIGGNRMRKKTANQGQAAKPFPGDEASLRKALATGVNYHNGKRQAAHLANKSPNEAFDAFVQGGWKATVLDPSEMAVAFSKEMVKPVRAGGTLRLDSQDFRADALQTYVGRKVLVRQPMFGDRETLFVFTEHGEPIAIARPDTRFDFGDPAGAGEQARRTKALSRDVRALALEGSRVLAGGEQAMAEVVALHDRAVETAMPDNVIRLNPEFSEAAKMAKSSPAQPRTEADRKQAKLLETYALINSVAANVG